MQGRTVSHLLLYACSSRQDAQDKTTGGHAIAATTTTLNPAPPAVYNETPSVLAAKAQVTDVVRALLVAVVGAPL